MPFSLRAARTGALLVMSCAGILGCASAGTRAPARPGVRVLVYNIHAGKDAAGTDSLTALAGLVRSTGADVVLLQEVDQRTNRSGHVDQPAALAAATGLHAAFGSALDFDGGKYGVAILSRWPITSDTLIHLPVTPVQTRAGGSHEPRGVLRVVLASPAGPVTVFNTHLDASGEDRFRRQEADTITRLVARALEAGQTVIAGGDFNSTPESAVQSAVRGAGLRDAWAECGAGEGLTFPDKVPVKRIDYLFLTGGVRCTSARVVDTRISDHRPLLVELTLPANRQ